MSIDAPKGWGAASFSSTPAAPKRVPSATLQAASYCSGHRLAAALPRLGTAGLPSKPEYASVSFCREATNAKILRPSVSFSHEATGPSVEGERRDLECARPRAQQRGTSSRRGISEALARSVVAAPGDGRTPPPRPDPLQTCAQEGGR